MSKQSSRKAQRQAAHARASRQKLIRYGGFGVILLVALVGFGIWRGANVSVADSETAVSLAPLLDGPAAAPIKVVKYADLTCSACRQWHNMGIKEQLRAEFGDQISFEFRHFPVITASSPNGAQAAQCAAEQDGFWPFHDYVYENLEPYPNLNTGRVQEIASAIGLDREAFDSCLDSGRYRTFVTEAIERGQQDGVRGTPTFFINGQPVFPSYQEMSATINDLLGN
ncbi:MAG: thioredoxin domain-containing protein [Anaerolineae bacterium]